MRFILNLKDGESIAVIKTEKNDIKHIVYLKDVLDEEYTPDKKIDKQKMNYIYNNLLNKTKERLNFKKIDILMKHIQSQSPPIGDMQLEKLYDEAMVMLEGKYNQQMLLNEKGISFFPIFNMDRERNIFFITGASGSGKSTVASILSMFYHKLYPKQDIYLFSNKTEDPVFDNKKYINRIDINNKDFVENPIDLNELENSMVIYDDNEFGRDPDMAKEMERLSKLIMLQGRSKKIDYILINHLMTDYKRTRDVLNEMSHFIFFPAFTTKYSVSYVLGKYFGLDPKTITKIFTLPSRYVCIVKNPLTCISSKEIFLLT